MLLAIIRGLAAGCLVNALLAILVHSVSDAGWAHSIAIGVPANIGVSFGVARILIEREVRKEKQ